jgi:hypothetical protein
MKNKFLLAIIFFLAITLAGCGRNNAAPQPAAVIEDGHSFVAIKNPQKMVHRTLSIYKPADWQEVKQGMILFYLPPGVIATNTVAEKIVLTVYSIPKTNTSSLATLMKEDFVSNQKGMAGLKFSTSSEPVKLGPLSGREEKYINQIIGKRIFIDQIDARSGDFLYKIQHYCAEGACQADAIFAEMVASFEVIPQSTTGK